MITALYQRIAFFGWCRMPAHLVRGPIAEGRLKALKLAESSSFQFLAHVVHVRGREIGRAGRWLIEDLRTRMGDLSIASGERRSRA